MGRKLSFTKLYLFFNYARAGLAGIRSTVPFAESMRSFMLRRVASLRETLVCNELLRRLRPHALLSPHMSKAQILQQLRAVKVIALIRADSSNSLLECARALAAGGLNAIELTMTTPGALEMTAKVARELPDVLLGLGTVLDADTARAGIDAGAKFIVTPAVRPAVIAACRERDVPILCGALTPTEAITASDLGADVIKIFPAEFFGPAYIKSLKAPFPSSSFCQPVE